MASFIIIGGGILGASTAYHLAKQDVKVTLIDRRDSGQASAAAAGIICPWISQRRNKKWYALVRNGAKYYKQLVSELEKLGETSTGYKQVGAIALQNDEKKLQKMLDRALEKRQEAPEIGELKILSPAETKSLFPLISEDFFSLYVEGAARVDGRAMRDALICAAKKLGAEIINGDAQLSDGVVFVNGKQLIADKIILTAGAWGNEIPSKLGKDMKVSFQKAQIMHLDIEDKGTGKWPVVLPPTNQYLLAFDEGKIIAGSTYEEVTEFDHHVTEEGKRLLLENATSIAKTLETAQMEEVRVGFRPFTPEFLPVIGNVPGFDSIFFANGLGASGLTAGPFVGAELARLALGHKTVLDLSLYAPN
ncbi:NAD(P)/FAD-dependent oxidoreductase [Psychrobacillus lasiicapitis]|uniref:FAD-binding oxidoreductase n=1 Tax=Psychrobacillus lasiicapitis TaxID=1636719 RepID=A0A544SYE6_9BACI|nr:FAD-binding oxidoreductase [Psychrobacillus lasiicapitis]TQR10226.1 FAD-binding oxidoreductase [Psychrobacillus lasiicapitis]GGA46457.1 oxidoreductase [Psychrobacillus lasiicapitis]